MAKRLMIVSGIFIVFIGLCQILLPRIAAEALGKAAGSLGQAKNITVAVEKFPAMGLLMGNFDRIVLTAQAFQTENIAFETVTMRLEDIQLDVLALLREHRLQIRQLKQAELQAIVSEDTLAAMINQKVKGAKDAQVKITPEKVIVQSTLSLGKMASAAVVLEGKIIVSGSRIVFTTERFNIDNPILGKLGGAIFTDLVLTDFTNLPFDVKVKTLQQEMGRVVIQADNY